MMRAFCAGLAVAGVAAASSPSSSNGDGLEEWIATQRHQHGRLVARGDVAVVGVSNSATLPSGCNYTLPPPVTTTVLCVSDTNSPDYDPIGLAQAISAVPGIQALSFAVNIAPETGTFLNDSTLGLVGANLNSTTVNTLHIFLGPLRKVSGKGIASFTALNPTVRGVARVTGLAGVLLLAWCNPVYPASHSCVFWTFPRATSPVHAVYTRNDEVDP